MGLREFFREKIGNYEKMQYFVNSASDALVKKPVITKPVAD